MRKKTVLSFFIFFLSIGIFIFSDNQIIEKRIIFKNNFNIVSNKYIKIYNEKVFQIQENKQYDISQINNFFKNNMISQANILLDGMSNNDYFIKHIALERKLLQRDKECWTRNSEIALYKNFIKVTEKNRPLINLFPPFVTLIPMYTDIYNPTFITYEFIKKLKINSEDIFVSNLVYLNNSEKAIFYLKGLNYYPDIDEPNNFYNIIYFLIEKIDNSLFSNINNKFEITTIFIANNLKNSDKEIFDDIIFQIKNPSMENFNIFRGFVYGINDTLIFSNNY